MEQNLNRYICSNIPGVNPKFFQSAYVVKDYVPLTMILPSIGVVKPGGPLVLFDKSRLMSVLCFSFISQLPLIHYTTI